MQGYTLAKFKLDNWGHSMKISTKLSSLAIYKYLKDFLKIDGKIVLLFPRSLNLRVFSEKKEANSRLFFN